MISKDTLGTMDDFEKDANLVQITNSYLTEARDAKVNRMQLNKLNFEAYHLRQDWSHKAKGQSREFLAKQSMAVEQISTFMQMGLVDNDDWFGVDANNGAKETPITPNEVKMIISWALEKSDFLPFIGDQIKMALLQSLAISKIHGGFETKPLFYTEVKEVDGKYKDVLKRVDKKSWVPKIDLLRAEDFYPDPSGKGLYFIQEMFLDISDVYKLAEGEDAIYDLEKVKELHGSYVESDLQNAKKSRETNQNTTISGYRKKVKIHECWGTVLDQGTGMIIAEKQKWTIADNRVVLEKPTDWPYWHGEVPVIGSPLIRVPGSVWHKSLMDAPTRTNIALNEIYNLMVDCGMMSAHGIKQIRTDWLDDTSQVSDGIYAGVTLKVSSTCPPGQKVLERVDTSSLSSETFSVFQQMNAEFSASSLTNDLRMGVMPQRAVKATEVVEASQSITSVFTGLAKVVEVVLIKPILDMTWKNVLQHFNEIDEQELSDVLGADRVMEIKKLSKEELFARCCSGFKFKVYGISRILAKQKDFRKLTALLQTIASSPVLTEEFMKKYGMGELLTEIIESLDINTDKLKISDEDKAAMMMAQEQAGQQNAAQSGGANEQSQIPQASAQGGEDTLQSRIPRSDFGTMEGKASGGMN